MEKPLVDKKYLLQKFPGKGGWTFAAVPEIMQNKANPFGWVKVKGSIDGFEIKNYHCMPMGNGKLFLAVKADIRKKIKKQAGDEVHIILFADHDAVEMPEELRQCMEDEPGVYQLFLSYTDGEKKAFIDWIKAAKKEDTRTDRIAKTIRLVQKGERLHQPAKKGR